MCVLGSRCTVADVMTEDLAAVGLAGYTKEACAPSGGKWQQEC